MCCLGLKRDLKWVSMWTEDKRSPLIRASVIRGRVQALDLALGWKGGDDEQAVRPVSAVEELERAALPRV